VLGIVFLLCCGGVSCVMRNKFNRVVNWSGKVWSMSGSSYPTFFASILLVGLAGCTVTRSIHLYPINPIPSETPVLPGVIVGHGQGHGTAKITMPDGEILLGEYSIVFGDSMGFGAILDSVYPSSDGKPAGGAYASVKVESGGSIYSAPGKGSASLVGPHGTSMQCEFLNANMTGHGSGACRSSKGNLYRMLY
jgi:hypothetical protein